MRQSDLRVELTALVVKYNEKYGHTWPRKVADVREGLNNVMKSDRDKKQKLRDLLCFGAMSLQLWINVDVDWRGDGLPADVTEMIYAAKAQTTTGDPFGHLRRVLNYTPFDQQLLMFCVLAKQYLEKLK